MVKITDRDITDCLESSLNELCPGLVISKSHFKELVSVEIAFCSEVFSGTLQFSSDEQFIATVSPIKLKDEADKLDYCQEFCNILMGRFRYNLLELGIDVSFGVPRVSCTFSQEGEDRFEKAFKYKGSSSKLCLIYKLDKDFSQKCSFY